MLEEIVALTNVAAVADAFECRLCIKTRRVAIRISETEVVIGWVSLGDGKDGDVSIIYGKLERGSRNLKDLVVLESVCLVSVHNGNK